MAILGLRDAAKLAGISRQTIYRYAKNGKLSTVPRDDGTRGVDTSELERVFGALRAPETVSKARTGTSGDRDRDNALQGELEATRQALAMAREQLTAATGREARLLEIVERQTKLLEHKPEPDEAPGIAELLGLGKRARCPHCGDKMKTSKLERHIRDRHM